jgi:hypothetical protein
LAGEGLDLFGVQRMDPADEALTYVQVFEE